jgi:threonine dehydrogenase-like Zn-dependent dehydrogenase
MPFALMADKKTPVELPCGLMQANVFRRPGEICLEQKPIPTAGPGEAVIQVRLTTISGTDVHIVRGEYPLQPGLTLGHGAVGVIHELGAGVTGYSIGQRVLIGAITPCGQCEACLRGEGSQCGGPLGGRRFGNTIDGVQAEYALIPNAQANLAVIPEALSDEQVILLADIASTGFAAAERGKVRLGDTVAVFAQGPIGLCATLGARLMGASEIIAIDADPGRLKIAQRFGATSVILAEGNPLEEIREVTEGRGVDVAIEALGTQETFENAFRALRPGGRLSSVSVYSGHLTLPLEALRAGLGEQTIVTTLCPGGKERMQRLMRLVTAHRIDLTPLLTHFYPLSEIKEAYQLLQSHDPGVLKIGIRVSSIKNKGDKCCGKCNGSESRRQ